jgi:hypothetical protein
MKKKKIDLILARKMVRTRCMVIGHVPTSLFLVVYWILKYYGIVGSLPPLIIVFIVFLGAFVLPRIMIDYAEKHRWPEQLFEQWMQERKDNQSRLEKKMADTRTELKHLKEDMKGSYVVENVFIVPEHPLALMFELKDEIFENLLPRVLINGEHVPVVRKDNKRIICYLSKVISTESDHLTMLVGKTKFEMRNPYFLNPVMDGVVWQCEGHAHERQIVLSSNQMPYAMPQLSYPFSLYIQNKLQGEFIGTLEGEQMVIPIKAVRKTDCDGKIVTLRANFGRGVTMTLPPPCKVALQKI